MDVEIIRRWVDAHETGDREALAEHMADGFVFEQEGLSRPLNKEEYLDLVTELNRAFPDLGVEAYGEPIDDEEGRVRWSKRFSATHEQDLDLTDLDLPFFVSTGTEIAVDMDQVSTHIEDGQIIVHEIEEPSAGITALFDELETGIDEIRREAREHEPRAPGR